MNKSSSSLLLSFLLSSPLLSPLFSSLLLSFTLFSFSLTLLLSPSEHRCIKVEIKTKHATFLLYC